MNRPFYRLVSYLFVLVASWAKYSYGAYWDLCESLTYKCEFNLIDSSNYNVFNFNYTDLQENGFVSGRYYTLFSEYDVDGASWENTALDQPGQTMQAFFAVKTGNNYLTGIWNTANTYVSTYCMTNVYDSYGYYMYNYYTYEPVVECDEDSYFQSSFAIDDSVLASFFPDQTKNPADGNYQWPLKGLFYYYPEEVTTDIETKNSSTDPFFYFNLDLYYKDINIELLSDLEMEFAENRNLRDKIKVKLSSNYQEKGYGNFTVYLYLIEAEQDAAGVYLPFDGEKLTYELTYDHTTGQEIFEVSYDGALLIPAQQDVNITQSVEFIPTLSTTGPVYVVAVLPCDYNAVNVDTERNTNSLRF